MRQRDEVERVSAIVGDLDQRLVIVGLDDRSDGASRPAAWIDEQLDHCEDFMLTLWHRADGGVDARRLTNLAHAPEPAHRDGAARSEVRECG